MNQLQRTVLIVDDLAEDRELYRRCLLRDQDYSYEFLEAESGCQGLELCQQNQPDVILLDYRLPDLDGLGFLAKLQTQQPFLPVIMLTGQGNEVIAVQAIKAGAQDYLVKGQISPESLQLAVNGAIEAVQLRSQLQQRIEKERLIAQISQQINQSLNLDEILQTTVTEVRQFLNVDRVIVFQLQPDGNGKIVTESVQAKWQSLLSSTHYDPCLAENNIRQRLEVLNYDPHFNQNYVEHYHQGWVTAKSDIYDGSMEPCHVELLARFQVKANLVIPIMHEKQFWGLLIAHHCASPRVWQPLEIELLQQLTTHVSIALRQAELYQQTQYELAKRQKVENALRSANERLQHQLAEIEVIYNTAPIGLTVLDTELRYLRINQRLAEINGYPVEAHIGRTVREVVPDLADTAERLFRSLLETGIPQLNIELQGETPAQPGVKRIWLEHFLPLKNGDQIIGISVVCEEITERKQLEEVLRQSEELKRRMLESSSDCIKLLDFDGRLLYMNAGGMCLMEIDNSDDYLDQKWADFWQEEARQEVETAIATAKAGNVSRFQGYCPTAKETPKFWDVVVSPILDATGKVIELLATSRDISKSKQAELDLRESEERYRSLAELIPQLVWTASGEGTILDVNQRWSDFTGLSLERAQTLGWQTTIHPEDTPILNQQWAIALQTGTYYQAEGRMRRSDGTYRWHLHQAMPQKNERGQIFKWFGTATDIEAQKQLEIERDRVLDLEKSARAEAERANRIKDEFLAVLSHELRSPLNPILGWAQLLQTQKLDPSKTAQGLETIERNAKLQAQLIDDLLDVAKILRGKLSLNATPLNPVFVIEAAIDTVKIAAAAKSISLQPTLPNIGQISGDITRLQQIFWNLLSNAIKFTPSGGRVDLCLKKVGDSAQITVGDTGKGISPEFLPHMFGYFLQEDASITRKHGGLGLGLAIVRHLVEAHGGTISADSRGTGQGATFTVEFPLLKVEPETKQLKELLNQESDLDLTGIRVLCVDDELDTRKLLEVLLAHYGASVLTLASGVDVLMIIESFQPNILISDIGMPEVDGYTVLQQVRSLTPEKGGQIPAIALTAYAAEKDQQKALDVGFQQHLTKPVDPDRLVQAIIALVNKKKG